MSKALSTANSMLSGYGSVSLEDMGYTEIPVSFKGFLPLFGISLAMTATIFASLYLIFKLKKQTPKSFHEIANVVGISSLPMTASFLLNLILGFVFPQFTVFTFLAAALISEVVLYESFRSILEAEKAPILAFAFHCLIQIIVLFIIFQIVFAQTGTAIAEAANNTLRTLF